MPNPQGFNGITPTEPAYGERKRMGAAQRSAPLAGGQASASAQNPPRRSKDPAARGTQEAAPV